MMLRRVHPSVLGAAPGAQRSKMTRQARKALVKGEDPHYMAEAGQAAPKPRPMPRVGQLSPYSAVLSNDLDGFEASFAARTAQRRERHRPAPMQTNAVPTVRPEVGHGRRGAEDEAEENAALRDLLAEAELSSFDAVRPRRTVRATTEPAVPITPDVLSAEFGDGEDPTYLAAVPETVERRGGVSAFGYDAEAVEAGAEAVIEGGAAAPSDGTAASVRQRQASPCVTVRRQGKRQRQAQAALLRQSESERGGFKSNKEVMDTVRTFRNGLAPFAGAKTLTTAALALTKPRRLSAAELQEQGMAHAVVTMRKTEKALLSDEKRAMAPVDSVKRNTFDDRARRSMLHYYKRHPVNHMIKHERVLIGGVETEDGMVRYPEEERQLLTAREGRNLAAQHGKDLVEISVLESYQCRSDHSDAARVSLCYIVDHVSHALDDLEFGIKLQQGHKPDPVKEPLEVGFRGSTHEFAIRVKARYIAKFVYNRHPVKLNLSRFGTPREGFPVFEHVLTVVREHCDRLKSRYRCGKIQYDQGKIFCYLHPATEKAPLEESQHPAEEEFKRAMDQASFDEQYDREVELPAELKKHELNRYRKALAQGTAWSWRSEGLSLKQQRQLKILQGWIPKGNQDMFSRRGDVELNHPYNTRLATSHEKVSHPRESNIEQATRGAEVLAKRAHMAVSDMYDQGETEDNTSVIVDTQYRMSGQAIDVGDFKTSVGLKRNRNKVPRFAAGFATMGMEEPSGDQYDIEKH